MNWKRYLVHLSVLCLVGTAAALANPFFATVHEGVIYGDVRAEAPPSAGVAGVQQQTVQLDAEMRATKRAHREFRAEDPVASLAVTFDARWLDVEEEMRLFQEEHIRFLAERSAREAHAAGDCHETQ